MDSTNNTELHVIFGTGPLGKATARELVKLGKRVRMINRSGKVENLPATVQVVASDAYDTARNIELTRGATTIYQCSQPHYYEWAKKFPPLQKAILEAAIANGTRFVAAENVYMYGYTHGTPMTEQTPHAAHTKKGKVRQAMSEEIFAVVRAGKVQAAVVRGSDFFGPEDPNYAALFFKPALSGKKMQMIGRLDMPHTWTFSADFGKALATVGTHAEAMGQVWHVPSDAAVTGQELVDLIAAEVAQPVGVMVGGKPLLWVMGFFDKNVQEIVEMVYEFDQPFVLDSSKFTRTFGIQPTPLQEAVRQTVAWNRQQMTDNRQQTIRKDGLRPRTNDQ